MKATHLIRSKLREHFGFRDFRPGQAQAVASALAGHDVIAIMPTGSGKTVCFQLPALEMEGMTVVVSPLIALMKDQADQLRQREISVAVLNSSVSAAEESAAAAAIAAGEVEFVYVTPERLAKPETRQLLQSQTIDLFVVDEAHCISHWGHDFRPEYLALATAIDALGRPPVLAMTATATQDVLDDIRMQLKIPDATIVHTGFMRPNLTLVVQRCADEEAKRQALLGQLQQAEGTGIVYAATVKAVEELTKELSDEGIEVGGYHGRMAIKRRTAVQDDFMQGKLRTIIATNAFGLGIDKPDIRFVTHYHLPGTLEAYYQEVGRAGRDGQPSVGNLLYQPDDRKLQRFFTGGRYLDDSDLVNAYHALERFEKPPLLKQLEEASPLRGARLRHALAVFSAQGLVITDKKHRYRLQERGLSRETLARAATKYQERQHRDELKLEQMQQYAETSQCRWRRILDYFGSQELGESACGHCDTCAPAVAF